jgi:hypothetical protein
MKHRKGHILRLLLSPAIVATLTILILRGHDPSFASFHTRSPAEKSLARVIKHANFQWEPFYQAVAELSQAAGIKIECDDDVTFTGAYYRTVYLADDQITLGDALHELIAWRSESQLNWFPDGDRIRICLAKTGAEPMYVDEHLLPGLVAAQSSDRGFIALFSGGAPTFPVPRLYGDGDIDALCLLAAGGADTLMPDNVGVVWGRRLFILLPASSHKLWQDLLEGLRPDATASARRTLPFGTDVLDFANGAFRARDSRAASVALRSILPTVYIARQPLDKALESLSAQVGVRITLTDNNVEVFPDVEFHAKKITLASAVNNLLRQASPTVGGVEPDRDTIWICREVDPILRRVYDLRPSFAGCSEEECTAREARLLLPPRGRADSYEETRFLGQILIARGTRSELDLQEDIVLHWLRTDFRPDDHSDVRDSRGYGPFPSQ